MGTKLNMEQFIEKAKKKHGDKYDYSKVDLENRDEKGRVCIICNKTNENGEKHGEFWQTPNSHLYGRGCPKCKGNKVSNSLRSSLGYFIERARSVHGDKYDYSKVEYINNKTKICIVCPKHGEFWQTPDLHINNKTGCPKCKGERLTNLNTKPWKVLVKEMKILHNDKYEYDESTYVNSHKKIRIVCPKHGEFWQTPNSHLQGCGCNKCGGKEVNSLKEFVDKAKKIHGDKYDYSKVEYTNTDSKVSIYCPKHGEFKQTPHTHLRGVGCPYCNESHLEKEVYVFLDLSKETYERGKHFKWLGRKHLDFYFPNYNTAIECQGEQHFGLGGWAKGELFNRIKELDTAKKQLCEENGIKLFYFSHEPYDEFLGEKVYHDIEELIKDIKILK